MITKRCRVDTLRIVALVPVALVVAMSACATAAAPAVAPRPEASPKQTASSPTVVPVSPSQPAATGVRLKVLFKLDPRLSGGTYGGEHWVSPPTFTNAVQGGKEATVDASVEGLDSRGAAVRIGPTWSAEDPSMVVVSPVSPGATDRVQISVTRAGETTLTIAALGVSKVLRIKATTLTEGRGLQVAISQ